MVEVEEHLRAVCGGDSSADNAFDFGKTGEQFRRFRMCRWMSGGEMGLREELGGVQCATGSSGRSEGRGE